MGWNRTNAVETIARLWVLVDCLSHDRWGTAAVFTPGRTASRAVDFVSRNEDVAGVSTGWERCLFRSTFFVVLV